MSINVFSTVFKFSSLRNPKPMEMAPDNILIMPNSALIQNIVSINESNSSNVQKLDDLNSLLQLYIDSNDFIKSSTLFYSNVDINNPDQNTLELMYDNLIVRLLTKSNTNEVYGLLVKFIKIFAASLNSTIVDKVKIIIPEKITFSFTEFEGINENAPLKDESAEIIAEIVKYTDARNKIKEAKENNIIKIGDGNELSKIQTQFLPIIQFFGQSKVVLSEAETFIENKLTELINRSENKHNFPQTNEGLSGSTSLKASELNNEVKVFNEKEQVLQIKKLIKSAIDQGLTEIDEIEIIIDPYYKDILSVLGLQEIEIEEAEKRIDKYLNEIFRKADKIVPGKTFSLIGKDWKDITPIVNPTYVIEDENASSVMVYSQGCYLKYPIQVADLRVIEQQTVGYIPAEIAHINNTQRGEKNTRVTRRLKRIESFESLIQENEITKETDTQSTERFSVENEAYQVQQEENSWNLNASVSAKYGPINATVNGGYSSSSSETSGNSSSQQYAKEIFTRVLDRVSNRIRVERSVMSIEEFEETVTHEIDNSTQETKSYIYRWLNKLVRGTLKNYGKRLIFEVQVAHPSSYFLSRMIKEKPKLNIPDDPRELVIGGVKFNPQMIDKNNYIALSTIYKIQLETPPEEKIIISETFNSTSGSVFQGKLVPIKKGYACKKAIITNSYGTGWPGGNHIAYMIGNSCFAYWNNQDDFWTPRTMWLANEKENLAISIWQGSLGYIFNIEIHCEITQEQLSDWQTKAYYDLLDAYDNLKAQVDSKINEFDPNAPGLPPNKKLEVIRTELKKEAIRKMFRCNPFWVNDKFQVGQEYYPNCCLDSANAERVRFLESVFDWRNMTYELHPYFYANKSQWNKILDLEDDDPHFEAFLKASFATIQIPVYRDNLKEIAACNFIVNNAIGNYETIPEGLENLLEELSSEAATEFTTDIDGTVLPEARTSVDLGIFPMPTSLVILECSNQDGIKPLGFPQADAPETDVLIPMQYSPAIIADSCDGL